MKILKQINIKKVIKYWEKIEDIENLFDSHRNELIKPVEKACWFEAIIEAKDINKINIISSGDWEWDGLAENFDYKIQNVADRLDDAEGPIKDKIKTYIENYKKWKNEVKLVGVANNINKAITIIEGNKRATALTYLDKLQGTTIYLGMMNSLEFYKWSQCSLPNDYFTTVKDLKKELKGLKNKAPILMDYTSKLVFQKNKNSLSVKNLK